MTPDPISFTLVIILLRYALVVILAGAVLEIAYLSLHPWRSRK